jgi:ribonuclease III
MVRPSLEQLEERTGYKFRNRNLLIEALTHSSYVKEGSLALRDNERMEFLGDAVLNFAVTVRLFETFPEYDEGKLSLARSNLIAASHLRKVAAALDLGQYLRLGVGEEKSGGRKKAGILVDGLEALVAAVYRDGGLEAAQSFVERLILPAHLEESVGELFLTNYKGALQEYLQAERQPPAQYRVVEEAGLEHQKTFTVEVQAGESVVARGRGGSKKAAEQEAAKLVLEILDKKVEADG